MTKDVKRTGESTMSKNVKRKAIGIATSAMAIAGGFTATPVNAMAEDIVPNEHVEVQTEASVIDTVAQPMPDGTMQETTIENAVPASQPIATPQAVETVPTPVSQPSTPVTETNTVEMTQVIQETTTESPKVESDIPAGSAATDTKTLEQQVSDATKTVEVANGNVTEAKQTVDEAKDAKDVAKADVDSAKEKLDADQKTVDEADSKMADAVSDAKKDAKDTADTDAKTADDANAKVADDEKAIKQGENDVEKSQGDVEQAQQKVDETQKALDEAGAENAEHAKDAYDKAAVESDNATKDAADADDKVTQATKTVNDAEKTKNAADANLGKAKGALDDANVGVKKAEDALGDANKELTDAQNGNYSSAQKAEIERTQKALDDANKALADAAADKESAANAYEQAKKSAVDAASALSNLEDELKKAELAYTIALRKQEALQNISEGKSSTTIIINDGDKITKSDQLAIDQAQAESYMYNCRDDVERAKKNVTKAQAVLDEAKKALDVAKQPIKADASQGSLGFFKWLTSLDSDNQDAIDVLTDSSITGIDIKTNKPFLNMTHIGVKDDSTSLENVKRALEYIKQCNDIRAKDPENPNLPMLKVNTFLMGLAEVNANWTMSNSLTATGAHATFSGENSYAGENAAGSYNMPWYDPFEAWYTDERIDFLNHTPNAQTGHYKAIVDAKNEETGFGVNTNTFGADPLDQRFIQEFSSSRHNTRGVTYTYDEFMALFNAYYAAATNSANATTTSKLVKVINNRLAIAQKGMDDANDALAIAKDDYATAQQDFKAARQAVLDYYRGKKGVKTAAERAKAKLDSAKRDAQNAKQNVDACKTKIANAQKTLDAANARLASAKSAKDIADNRYDRKVTLVNVAQDAYEIAKRGNNAKAISDAQAAVTKAKDNLNAAKRIASAAQSTYDKAKQEVNKATKAIGIAKAALDDANKKATTAHANADAARATLEQAANDYAKYKGVIDAHDSAVTDLATKKTILDDAIKALADSKARLADDIKVASDAKRKAEESQAAYELVAGITLDDILSGKTTAPEKLVKSVMDIKQAKDDAQGRLDADRKAYDAALDRYDAASKAYDVADYAYKQALLDAIKANDEYASLLRKLNELNGSDAGTKTPTPTNDTSDNKGTVIDNGMNAGSKASNRAGSTPYHSGSGSTSGVQQASVTPRTRWISINRPDTGAGPYFAGIGTAYATPANTTTPSNANDVTTDDTPAIDVTTSDTIEDNVADNAETIDAKNGNDNAIDDFSDDTLTNSNPSGEMPPIQTGGVGDYVPAIGLAVVGGALVATLYVRSRNKKAEASNDGNTTKTQ